jgi:hypothetical protein
MQDSPKQDTLKLKAVEEKARESCRTPYQDQKDLKNVKGKRVKEKESWRQVCYN